MIPVSARRAFAGLALAAAVGLAGAAAAQISHDAHKRAAGATEGLAPGAGDRGHAVDLRGRAGEAAPVGQDLVPEGGELPDTGSAPAPPQDRRKGGLALVADGLASLVATPERIALLVIGVLMLVGLASHGLLWKAKMRPIPQALDPAPDPHEMARALSELIQRVGRLERELAELRRRPPPAAPRPERYDPRDDALLRRPVVAPPAPSADWATPPAPAEWAVPPRPVVDPTDERQAEVLAAYAEVLEDKERRGAFMDRFRVEGATNVGTQATEFQAASDAGQSVAWAVRLGGRDMWLILPGADFVKNRTTRYRGRPALLEVFGGAYDVRTGDGPPRLVAPARAIRDEASGRFSVLAKGVLDGAT